jgi:hypothetical protein
LLSSTGGILDEDVIHYDWVGREREREEEEGGIIITRYLGAINKYAFTGLFEIAQLEEY